ncbi:hypothetical protein FQA39_LY15750 [Lamprigera yunnana]|nr:hypothetical protein FQA39_LY15750 [Lamprigera yunnana]
MIVGSDDTNLTTQGKYELITRNLSDVSDRNKLKSILEERNLKIYWGVLVADKLDVSYFVALTKIADFVKAGAEVTILCADLHAYLDNKRTPWELLSSRAEYYENSLKEMLISMQVPTDNVRFQHGINFQLLKEYTLDVYKLSSLVTTQDAKEAGEEVLKLVTNPLMSSLLYPTLQALDEEYLKVDVHYGLITQKNVFQFAEKYLPLIGYQKRIHLTSPIVHDLGGGKASLEEESKIGILDLPQTIKSKLKKAFCEKGNVENNGILSITKHILFPLLRSGDNFVIPRSAQHGGDIVFQNYESIEKAFAAKELHPGDLKSGVEFYVNILLDPIRKAFEKPKLKQMFEKAYPIPGKKSGASAADEITPRRLDMRIGKVVEVCKHPEADGLYVEKIDVGEETPRTIVSGLVNFIPIEEMRDLLVLVLCNLKPAKLRGIESKGMLLCANVAEPKQIEAITPPPGTTPGEKVYVEGYEDGVPDDVLNPKKKIWEKLQVDLITDENCICQWQGKNLLTKSGDMLRLKKSCNSKEIKKAYYKLSLVYHPDRVEDNKKAISTEKFKLLGKIHSILQDDDKRKVYDECGTFDEENYSVTNWTNYWRNLFKKISTEDIENYKKEYLGSETEKIDIKKAYVGTKGDMNRILEMVPFSNCENEPRIIEIVRNMVNNGEVEEYSKFFNESKQKKTRRKLKEEREKRKSEQLNISDNDLAEEIHQRQTQRMDNFLSMLEAKYGNESQATKRKSIKGKEENKSKRTRITRSNV